MKIDTKRVITTQDRIKVKFIDVYKSCIEAAMRKNMTLDLNDDVTVQPLSMPTVEEIDAVMSLLRNGKSGKMYALWSTAAYMTVSLDGSVRVLYVDEHVIISYNDDVRYVEPFAEADTTEFLSKMRTHSFKPFNVTDECSKVLS